MELKFLKEYGKDWIIKDNHIEVIGQYKKDLQSGKVKPKKMTGHRISQITGHDFFVPPWMAEAEALGLWKPEKGDDMDIYCETGKMGEDLIVEHLNKKYKSKGKTYAYEDNPGGDAFPEVNYFGGLPDYITEGKYVTYQDGNKGQKVIEIKTTGRDIWKRDNNNKNVKLDITEFKGDYLPINNNNVLTGAFVEMYDNLTKKELAKLTPEQKAQLQECYDKKDSYLKNPKIAKMISGLMNYCLIENGVNEHYVNGDKFKNKAPILMDNENTKLKDITACIKIKDENGGFKRWCTDGKITPRTEYIIQVALYTFLYELKQNPHLSPEQIKGKKTSEICLMFINTNQYLIPENHWFKKFNFQPAKPEPLKITKDNYFELPIEIDLHKFYTTYFKPAKEIYENTVMKQRTDIIDDRSKALLRRAFRENGLDIDNDFNVSKFQSTKELETLKQVSKQFHKKQKNQEYKDMIHNSNYDVLKEAAEELKKER